MVAEGTSASDILRPRLKLAGQMSGIPLHERRTQALPQLVKGGQVSQLSLLASRRGWLDRAGCGFEGAEVISSFLIRGIETEGVAKMLRGFVESPQLG